MISSFIQAWCRATVYSYFTAQEKEIIIRYMDVTLERLKIDGGEREREREREGKIQGKNKYRVV